MRVFNQNNDKEDDIDDKGEEMDNTQIGHITVSGDNLFFGVIFNHICIWSFCQDFRILRI